MMYAIAQRQHQHRRRAEHDKTGADLLAARLQECLFIRFSHTLGATQRRQNGADADIHIDIRSAIERIKQQRVFAFGVAMRNRVLA